MEAGKRWKPMSSFMLPAVPLSPQYTLNCICVVVFLIYEMADLRNEFGSEEWGSHWGKSISLLPSYVHLQHVLFYPPLHITHPSRPSLLQRRQDAYSYGTWQHLWVRWWKTGKSSVAQLLSKYRVIQAICASSWLWLDKLRDWATIWGDVPESAVLESFIKLSFSEV